MAKSETKQSGLTIGHLASESGINVETVRYYQRIGMIIKPEKPQQGFRKYSRETVNRIKFIKRAQELGFSLKEIAELLELGEGHCSDIQIRAQNKRDKIQQQINDLQVLYNTLNGLIASCEAGENKYGCPIVQTLLQ